MLKNIFWQMHTIDYRTEAKVESEITISIDCYGNIVETETNITRIYLYIETIHKTADAMAIRFAFNTVQKSN